MALGYTVRTGIGSMGTVLLGSVLFQEKITAKRLLCSAAIILGVVGLKLTSRSS